jgi:glucose dehydrogenase
MRQRQARVEGYSTGPDKDVLIGPDYRAPIRRTRAATSASAAGRPEYWKIGGGTVWGWISYDPELKLIYYGTSNPGPWNAEQRPGDNKWTAGVFARDIGTGQARWFYQSTPHDLFDHDDINEIVLVDWPAERQRIPALIRPSRNGYFYVQDRRTGKILSADPYATSTPTRAST